MTNGEAIQRLKEGAPFSALWDKQWEEALSMAIEALENNDKLAEDLQNCLEMYKKKKAEVEALKQNQWIPCSERLPSKGMPVLVNGIMEGAPPMTISTDAPLYYKNGWINAWMPLPKPYEGRTE